MKTAKLLLIAGLISGLASIAFAGPGIQYWQQKDREAAARKAAKSEQATPAQKDTRTMKDGVCEKCACSSKCACAAPTKS
jgi:ABC-type cobalamin transport system ATPase subunit